jgi:hypothetical protein
MQSSQSTSSSSSCPNLFTRLWQEHKAPSVARCALKLVRAGDGAVSAEDIVSEAYIQLFEAWVAGSPPFEGRMVDGVYRRRTAAEAFTRGSGALSAAWIASSALRRANRSSNGMNPRRRTVFDEEAVEAPSESGSSDDGALTTLRKALERLDASTIEALLADATLAADARELLMDLTGAKAPIPPTQGDRRRAYFNRMRARRSSLRTRLAVVGRELS